VQDVLRGSLREGQQRTESPARDPLVQIPIHDPTQMNTDPTAPEVERYRPIVVHFIEGGCEADLDPCHSGDWVRYEDYEKLKEEFMAMAGKNADLFCKVDDLKKDIQEMEAELTDLRWETRHLR